MRGRASPADEAFAGELSGEAGMVVTAERDNFDYLYRRRDLAELPGNRFHRKKNRVNYFTARHPSTVELYREEFREGFEGVCAPARSSVRCTRPWCAS